MEGISDIRIIGLDPARLPRVQVRPCIDLNFELTHQAPEGWCKEFNTIAAQVPYSVVVDPITGLFIETWVRKKEEIAGALVRLKATVSDCNTRYIRLLEEKAKASGVELPTEMKSKEQSELDGVVDALNFDD